MSGNCIHWVPIQQCGICTPRVDSSPKRALVRTSATTPGRSEKTGSLDWAVVHTNKRNHPSFKLLNERVTLVHIDGHPFVWALEQIFRLAPNVQAIQVIPSNERKLTETHRRLCRERNIAVIAGHYNANLAWSQDRIVSPLYRRQRHFLQNLEGERKQLFDELLQFGFECALITARYFCLKDDEYKPYHVLAPEFGLPDLDSVISKMVNGVLGYLEPSFLSGGSVEAFAKALRARVERLRQKLASDAARDALTERLQALGIPAMPDGLALAHLPILEQVLVARQQGGLERLRKSQPRDWTVLVRYYGIEDGRSQTLEEIGAELGVTRERIRQLRNRGLSSLEIEGGEL